jgi:hypothetical protein
MLPPTPNIGTPPVSLNASVRLYDQELADQLNLLGQLRKTPLLLYGIFVELVRQFYSNAYNIPINTCAIWTADEETSGMWIDSDYKVEDSKIEKRPAIYVKLGPIEYSSATGQSNSQTGMVLEEGQYNYSRYGQGTVTFRHIGTSKGQTMVLAGSTLDYLDAFANIIAGDFCFEQFEVVRLTPIALDKSESKDRYHCDIVCRFKFQDTWTLKLESPKLKKLTFTAGQNLLTGDSI